MSFRLLNPVLILAAALPLVLGACATAEGPGGPDLAYAQEPPPPPPPEYAPPAMRQEILAELPQDAPPGDCYARVIIPGQPVLAPPQAPGAAWVLNPGPPGSPGPIWCLVPTGPGPAQVVLTPERDGWIRVLCDVDATPPRIERWQKRLHKEGYYRGAPNGRYDGATADAVGRFQRERHIEHGGYLSLDTVGALEGPPPPVLPQQRIHQSPGHAPPFPTYAQAAPRADHGYAAAAAGGVGYAPYPAVAQQPAYGYPAYPSYPAYPQAYPAPPQAYAYPQAGYAQQGYAAQSGSSASYQSRSYSSSSQGGYSYAAPQGYAYGQGYAQQGYAGQSGSSASYQGRSYASSNQGGYGYAAPQGYAYGQGYAVQGYGYSQGYSYGQTNAYYGNVGPRPAYAADPSAIKGGWLTWAGKSNF